jgi:hypothetical protein
MLLRGLKMGFKVNTSQQYAKCVDCQVRRIVARKEWNRASQPRCYACGGRLEICGGKSSKVNVEINVMALERKALERERNSHEA